MKLPNWENNNVLNYSSNGETADTFLYKTKMTFEQIFELLNILKSGNAQAGLDATDTSAYQFRVNTKDNSLYIRDGDNASWIYLGKIEANFGITPEVIGAIVGGNVKKISSGLDANKPTSGNNTNDFYFATDKFKLYKWTGSSWQIALSLNFEDILDYERYCISRNEVDYTGKDKIPRLDAVTGKGNFDITGSPEKLLGFFIDVQNLKDGDVLVYNQSKNKIVNLPKDDVKSTDLTVSGEAGKIVKIHTDGKIHANLEGSASKIDDVTVNATNIKNGQVLVYQDGYLIPADKDVFTEDDVTDDGEIGKLVKVNEDGTIHGKFLLSDYQATTSGEAKKFVKVANDGFIYGRFNGQTTQIGNIKLQVVNLKDGDVFVYHKATNTIKNEAKNTTGQGKNLILMDGCKLLGEYNGSEAVTVDIAKIIANSNTYFIRHILRLIENVYLTLETADLNPGGYDGMINVSFGSDKYSQIDQTSVLVTSQVLNDDSIDVDDLNVIVAGANYRIIEGSYVEEVQVKEIRPTQGINRIILSKPMKHQFTINVAKMVRSDFTVTDYKATGSSLMFVTKPQAFSAVKNRVHCVVKHQLTGEPNIKVEVSLRNSLTEPENFIEMTKGKTYSDDVNAGRGSTEYIFLTGKCTCGCANCICSSQGGMIGTIRITATGAPVVIDSFSAVFNE